MGVKVLMVAASVFALMQLWSCNGCLEDERVSLLQIEASFNISGFLYDGEEKKTNCCDWRGIECDARTGRVTHLDLSYARDWDLGDWYLNFSLFLPLKQLASLDLSYNNLKGSINREELASLKNLEELKLSGNKKISEIVASIGADFRAQTNLSTVYLNDMTDNGMPLLLKSLRLFSRLKTLYLQDNNLTKSSFRCESQSYKSLETLYLDGSVVDDNFFPSLDTLSSLKSLSFHDGYGLNTLRGLCNLNLSSLQSLVLTNNNLLGRLPLCLSNFTSLQRLDLSDNSLEGSLYSSSLSLLTHLVRIDLSDNKLRGEFPHGLLENNTRLEYLLLSNNSLTGTIKLPTHSHMNLSRLDISSNCFSGQIPTKFGLYFPNLVYLDMSQNEISGSFPSDIGNMSSLKYLDLSINYLFGELPEVLNCSSLAIFVISENDISGSLPMFSSSSLEEVYLAKNNLHGSLLWAFSNSSSHLRILVANHNSFTGTISKWIGNFSDLNFLQMAHNHLEGEIPSEVCKLNELQFIDLSNNNLFGQIPPCLKSSHIYYPERSIEFTTKSFSYSYKGITLELLVGIDLSCNKLIGKIPHELGNLTKIKALNLSHNSLRGSIPSTFSNLEEIETLDLSHNNLEGKIPSQLTNLNFISSFSVSYNNLSGRTPDFVYQFATFENTSYEGNPFLCGKPLSKSCEPAVSPSPPSGPSTNSEEDDEGFMDMEVFYASFGVSYTMVLLGIVAVLYINPYWRRAWFYFIERKMTDCYYFIADLFGS